jgi:2-amino-4-hydroxy-6-hydroxymethyldihydropteridine diphosphokinase
MEPKPIASDTPWVLVAFGANLGNPEQQVREGMDRVESTFNVPLRRSSLYVSEPVDCPPGSPPFVNAGAAFPAPPGFTPESLLLELQRLEREFGRRPKVVLNEARPLDLDLIAWGNETRDTLFLKLPHPRAHLRRFVIEPLAEVLPDFVMPGSDFSLRQWLAEL